MKVDNCPTKTFEYSVSFDQAVNEEVLSLWAIVLHLSSFDQSPALWEGVAALPPLPMKCTLPPS